MRKTKKKPHSDDLNVSLWIGKWNQAVGARIAGGIRYTDCDFLLLLLFFVSGISKSRKTNKLSSSRGSFKFIVQCSIIFFLN